MSDTHRSLARRWLRPLVACAATLGTLLVLELGARVYANATNQARGMTFDAELGWRPLPHVTKIGGVWGVKRPAQSNAHGWRDAERTFEKPAGTTRVVAIGDSYTFGVAVDDGERFTDLLQDREHHLEVVNLGVAGYGTDQQLRVLELEAARYQPDIVLLTLSVKNDLDDIGFERIYSWPKPTYTIVNGELVLRKARRSWDILLRSRSDLVESLVQKFWSLTRPPADVRAPDQVPAAELFEQLIRQMAGWTSGRSIRLVAVLAYAPATRDPEADTKAAVMTRVLAGAGVPVLDTRDLLRRQSANPDTTYYAAGESHWNADGHQIVAQGIRALVSR